MNVLNETLRQPLFCLMILGAMATAGACADEVTQTPKTFGTMGKELKVLEGGKEAELFRHDGKGCLTHMWFGGDWPGYGRTLIRVYVDGEEQASIEMELMLGHGVGFDDPDHWGIDKIGKTGHPSGIYNNYLIPFGNGVRVTAQLPEDIELNPDFWWIIRGSEGLAVTVGGYQLPGSARLKLYKRNKHAQPFEEFDLCSTGKSGAIYQVTVAAKSRTLVFLEACMRAYIDGKSEPLFLSSGLEDYFLGTYYFNRGKYQTPMAGVTCLREQEGQHLFSAYRFHDQDPVFFHNDLRLSCKCGEKIDGRVFHKDPEPTEFTTYVWVYEW